MRTIGDDGVEREVLYEVYIDGTTSGRRADTGERVTSTFRFRCRTFASYEAARDFAARVAPRKRPELVRCTTIRRALPF